MLLLLLLALFYHASAFSFNTRVPIGLVCDERQSQIKTSLDWYIQLHNNETGERDFKIEIHPWFYSKYSTFAVQDAYCSRMSEKGVFAMFGMFNSTDEAFLESISPALHLPVIIPNRPGRISSCVNHQSYTFYVKPSYVRAVLDLCRHYGWKDAFYLFDSDDGLHNANELLYEARKLNYSLRLDIVRLTNISRPYAQLRSIDTRHEAGSRHIIVDIRKPEDLQTFLNKIQIVGMNRAEYHYILGGLTMDELDLVDFSHGGVNMTGFNLIDWNSAKIKNLTKRWNWVKTHRSKFRNSITVDSIIFFDSIISLLKAVENMKKVNKSAFENIFRNGDIYNNGSKGLTCKKWNGPVVQWFKGENISKAIRDVSFEGFSGQVEFDQYGRRKNFTLDILELRLDQSPQKIGNWSEKNGLIISKTIDYESNGADSTNSTKIITTILSSPYLMLKDQPENGKPLIGNDRFDGYCADLAREIAKLCNFRYEIRLVHDDKYGEKLPDGTWNGMVGELTNRSADLAIAPLTISSVRERVIDFSKPFMSLGISIMIKKPEKQKPGVFSFMDPLSSKIWMCVILAYSGVSVVLFLVSRFSLFEWHEESVELSEKMTNDFNLMNSMWFSLAAFMRQGCDVSPRCLSGRIVGGVWWFFTLIIISSYTANLAAFLTVERMLTPIESADDLSKQTHIQYGTLDAGSTKNFFATSNVSVYQRMWRFMNNAEPGVFAKTTAEGVERVRASKEKYAFLLESTMNDYYNQKKPCNTMKIGGNLDSKGYGIATPLGSPLREKINLAVLRLREQDVLQKLFKKWWFDKGECGTDGDSKKGSSQSALTLSNVAGIFYILIGGLGLAMITSLMEFLYKSHQEMIRRKKGNLCSSVTRQRNSPFSRADRENGGVGSGMQKSSTVPLARSSAVSLV